jgi:TIR domain
LASNQRVGSSNLSGRTIPQFWLLGGPGLRSIFLSYRRSDAEGEAGRLFDDLTLRFSPHSVFMDVAAIEPGRDFRKAIDQSVAHCSILLAMIGKSWLNAVDDIGQRRLEDANDFVRIELASALRRDIPVVPVLVQGAKMPRANELPDDLKELAYRNAVELTHARWRSDVQLLVQALQPYREPPETAGVAGEAGSVAEGSAASATATTSQPATTAVVPIEPQILKRVSNELATYIGPIADVVVRRAARQCVSTEDLCGVVAREIEGEGDRMKFLRSCRS